MFLELEHVRIHFRYQKWKYSPFLEKALRLPKIRNHLRGRKHYPSHPWNWYIYLHEWLVFMGNIASKPYIYPTVGVVYLHEWLDASLYLPTFGWGKSNKNHPNLGSDPNVKAVGLQASRGSLGFPDPRMQRQRLWRKLPVEPWCCGIAQAHGRMRLPGFGISGDY